MTEPLRFTDGTVTVEAVQFVGDLTAIEAFVSGDDIRNLDGEHYNCDADWRSGDLFVTTAIGLGRVRTNDWLIKNVHGHIYTCGPSMFAATYQPAH